MAGFPIVFTEDENRRLERIVSAAGMRKRPWVMKVIFEAMDAAEGVKVQQDQEWVFLLRDGQVLRQRSETLHGAWTALGHSLADVDLIAERGTSEEMAHVGATTGKTEVAELTLAPSSRLEPAVEDDLPFGK